MVMVLHRHLTAVQGASRELSALIQSGLGIGHQEAADDEVLRTRLCTWTKLGGSMPHCRLRGSATDTPPPVRKLARDERLWISGSLYQLTNPHPWTRYSDVDNVANEVDRTATIEWLWLPSRTTSNPQVSHRQTEEAGVF